MRETDVLALYALSMLFIACAIVFGATHTQKMIFKRVGLLAWWYGLMWGAGLVMLTTLYVLINFIWRS